MCEDNNLDSYRINVTWDLPTVNPDFYEVSINLFTNKAKVQSQNVSGVNFSRRYHLLSLDLMPIFISVEKLCIFPGG